MSNKLNKIPEKWKITFGANSRVGICDSGFDVNNSYIKNNIYQYKDFGSTNIEHGTHVMGIMCLNSSNPTLVKGMACDSKYYIAGAKIGGQDSLKSIYNALCWLNDFNLDVLNLSFTYYKESDEIRDLLYNMYKNGTIIVAAHSDDFYFPHGYNFVISAGYDIIAPNTFFSSTENDNFKSLRGTGMQSALISSIASCAKSFDKKINKKSFMDIVCGSELIDYNYFIPQQQYNIKI